MENQQNIGFNSRRASDFSGCEYLRPTMASLCRAKSVAAPGARASKNAASNKNA